MSIKFKGAVLMYGRSMYPVQKSDVYPFPDEFDMNDPAAFGLRVMRYMSQASGGHALHDCRVVVVPGVSAIVTANGAVVRYGINRTGKLTAEQAVQELSSMQFYTIGTVTPHGAAPEGPKPAVQRSARRWRVGA